MKIAIPKCSFFLYSRTFLSGLIVSRFLKYAHSLYTPRQLYNTNISELFVFKRFENLKYPVHHTNRWFHLTDRWPDLVEKIKLYFPSFDWCSTLVMRIFAVTLSNEPTRWNVLNKWMIFFEASLSFFFFVYFFSCLRGLFVLLTIH